MARSPSLGSAAVSDLVVARFVAENGGLRSVLAAGRSSTAPAWRSWLSRRVRRSRRCRAGESRAELATASPKHGCIRTMLVGRPSGVRMRYGAAERYPVNSSCSMPTATMLPSSILVVATCREDLHQCGDQREVLVLGVLGGRRRGVGHAHVVAAGGRCVSGGYPAGSCPVPGVQYAPPVPWDLVDRLREPAPRKPEVAETRRVDLPRLQRAGARATGV
jgi:hypothetical protein